MLCFYIPLSPPFIVLENTANLLQLDSYQLNDALTQKSMILRGEEILSPLNVDQAKDARDSISMALYSSCFKWLIKIINKRIKGPDSFHSIGVLDIFGFENFKVCIQIMGHNALPGGRRDLHRSSSWGCAIFRFTSSRKHS